MRLPDGNGVWRYHHNEGVLSCRFESARSVFKPTAAGGVDVVAFFRGARWR